MSDKQRFKLRFPYISTIGSSLVGALFANYIFILHWKVLLLVPVAIILIYLIMELQMFYWEMKN